MIELMDVYDENKNKIGKIINREDRHSLSKSEYTLSVHCFIINSKNEILLTQRSLKMKRPGLWEETHGGVRAGETSLTAIKRELQEEIGIKVNDKDLNLYKTIIKNDVIKDIYIINKDISLNEFNFSDEEVMNCKYVTIDELKNMIENDECSYESFDDTIFYNSDLLN